MTPQAVVLHKTNDRMRLRIASRRRDISFFDMLDRKITDAFPSLSVQTNAVTGSLLLCGGSVELDDLAAFGRSNRLFELAADRIGKEAMTLSITTSMKSANQRIRQLTGERVDLPNALFISLLIFGVIELMRGNWRTPPWYTAFWYAFGLYSKSLIDPPADAPHPDINGD